MDELERIVQRMIDAGESEDNIAAVIKEYHNSGVAPAVAGPADVSTGNTLLKTLAGMGKRTAEIPGELWQSLKTLTTTNPATTLKNLYEGQLQQFDKAGADAAQGRYSEMAGHGLAGLLPLLGPAAARSGEDIGSGDPTRAGRGIVDAGLTLAAGAPKATASAAGTAGRALSRAVRSPIGTALLGAGAGYATGGVPGAITGAAGGGVAARALSAFERMNPASKVLDDVRTATPGVERFATNTPASRVTRGVEGVSPEVRAASEVEPSVVDRYMANAPGEITTGVEGAEQIGPSWSRFSPNTPGQVTRGVEGAENFQPSVSRYSPNLPGDVGEGVEGAGGLLTKEQQALQSLDRFMPNSPGQVTRGVIEHSPMPQGSVLRGADQYPHTAPRPSMAPERAAFNTQTPDVVSDFTDTQAAPGLGDVDQLIAEMGDAPLSTLAAKAKQRRQQMDAFMQTLRGRQTHGTAGFKNLPQMSDAEAARIGASIDRITGR